MWHGVAAMLGVAAALGAAGSGAGRPYRLPRFSTSLGGRFPNHISFIVKRTPAVSLPPVSGYQARSSSIASQRSDEGAHPSSPGLPSAAAAKGTGRTPCVRSCRGTTPSCWDSFALSACSATKPH